MLVNQSGSKRNDVQRAVGRRPGTDFVQNDQGETV